MDDANQDFIYRNTNREDIAQIKAEEYFTSKKIFWRNFGTDPKDTNPVPKDEFFKMPPMIQRTPDMFAINHQFVFVEVKGCKEYLKVKLDDWREYIKWNEIARLMFFVYSATSDQRFLFYLTGLQRTLHKATMGRYEDNGKIYFQIPIIELEEFLIIS